ncbi:MAG: hypothetical protein AAF604_12325 [Acidobacteriota bacterium]
MKKAIALVVALLAFGLVPQGAKAQNPAEVQTMQEFVTLMEGYLGVAHEWVSLMSERERTVYMAIEGVTEIYEAREQRRKAVAYLEGLLEGESNRTIRNIVRFKLRDLYNELGEPDRALAQLEQVIADNGS